MTRSAYGYVYGNPLNLVDPSGLGVECILNPGSCDLPIPDSWEEALGGAQQPVANTAGGTLNGITLGHADAFIDENQVQWDSNWTRGGNAFGLLLDVPLLIPAAAEGAGLGAGTMVSAATVHGLVGYGSMGMGLYDLKQANDTCQAHPGSAACKRGLGLALLQTVTGGLFGFGKGNAAGCADWLFGGAESLQDVG
jgi:hypothetical protein